MRYQSRALVCPSVDDTTTSTWNHIRQLTMSQIRFRSRGFGIVPLTSLCARTKHKRVKNKSVGSNATRTTSSIQNTHRRTKSATQAKQQREKALVDRRPTTLRSHPPSLSLSLSSSDDRTNEPPLPFVSTFYEALTEQHKTSLQNTQPTKSFKRPVEERSVKSKKETISSSRSVGDSSQN